MCVCVWCSHIRTLHYVIDLCRCTGQPFSVLRMGCIDILRNVHDEESQPGVEETGERGSEEKV